MEDKLINRPFLIACSLTAIVTLGGCAGQLTYTEPASNVSMNTKTVNAPLDKVWVESVPALGKDFFVINNIDKSSGLINISYSGDPARYIDCGRMHSYVKNMRGERNYDFPIATPEDEYEAMVNGTLFRVRRTMKLDGRANIIFQAEGANKTKVTVNTRYVLKRRVSVLQAGASIPSSRNDEIAFNTGASASFPSLGIDEGQATVCQPNGQLESTILDAIR